MSNRDRAWTAEQVERIAKAADDPDFPNSMDNVAAAMLRAYATTLRQQTTNPSEIGSKLGGGDVASDAAVLALDAYLWKEHGVCLGKTAMRAALEAVAPLLRAPAERMEDGDLDAYLEEIENEVARITGDEGEDRALDVLRRMPSFVEQPAEPESKVYHCPRCATSMQVDPSAKPRAPAEQGGRVDEGSIERLRNALKMHDEDRTTVQSLASSVGDFLREAALAQNAQGKVWGYIGQHEQRTLAQHGHAQVLSRPLADLGITTPVYLHAERARVPDGLLDHLREAMRRIENGRAPRRIPAEPGDVDLALAEAIAWLEGKPAPFWVKPSAAAPSQPEDAKCSHTWVTDGIGPTRCSKCHKQPEDAA